MSAMNPAPQMGGEQQDDIDISHLSPKAQQIVAASQRAIYSQKFGEMFLGAMEKANQDIPMVASIIVMQLIAQGVQQVGEVSPDELYGDHGVDDAIMAYLFEWLQHRGYEVNTDIYAEALNMLETAAAEQDAQKMGGMQQQQEQGAAMADEQAFGQAGLAGGP